MDQTLAPGNFYILIGTALLAAVVGGCQKGSAPAAAAPPPPVSVQVAAVEQRDVPVSREWIGTLDGSVNAQIRAQVSGYLVKQNYREGAPVKKGEPLFEIDPRPFAASVAQAEGQLAQAEAQLGKAELDVKRYTPLVADKAVSQEELDDALQAKLAATAMAASARAAVEHARLNLDFARITSPVDGIAGLGLAQLGDLVGPTSGILTTVSTVDPIKAVFPISEQSYLEFRRREPGAPGLPSGLEFDLLLSDGTIYPRKGTLFAIDRQVDGNTGTMRAVAVFPNPEALLRPGQYARLRAVVRQEKGALLVPQRALSELQGGSQLAVVDAGNKVHLTNVKVGEQVGTRMVIESGLKPGDRVVAEGIQKVREGSVVNPLPFAPTEAAR